MLEAWERWEMIKDKILSQKQEAAHSADPKCFLLYHFCKEQHEEKGQ